MRVTSKTTLSIGISTMLALFLCVGSALAVQEITPTAVDPNAKPQNAPEAAPESEDSPSFLRRNTWNSSFDRAGDATRDAEVELKKGIKINCNPEQFKKDGVTDAMVQQQVATCEQKNAEAQNFGAEAGKIRSMQRIFADVSRVSDVAAVGSIGAVGYAELVKKNQSQSESLMGAARIQETAGVVSYTTGAADFSMGAYAYMAQKKKLEKMKETLSGVSGNIQMNAEDVAAVKKLAAAAEETKKAAYSHMMYGAGKAAVGYASMWMAKRNRELAASLSSLDMSMIPPAAPPSASSQQKPSGDGGVPYYPNNNVQFLLPTDSDGSSALPSAPRAPIVAGGGASVMPSNFRSPASAGGGKGGVSSAGGLGGGGGGAGSSPAGAPEGEAATAGKDGKEAISQGFEVSLSGGNSSRYGGGGEKSKEEAGVGDLLGGLLGGSPESKATGLNPNQLYHEATNDLDGTEETGSMAGVGGKDRSLFDSVRLKYHKMSEVGRLQGPGAVEVKN
jgi:hypothetical protein